MVYGIGINDMPYGWRTESKLNKRIYECWKSMICRCYDKKYQEKHRTYKNCYVCNKWLKLSGFVEDVSKINNYNLWINNHNYQLDKDIKSNGTNKCYCLEQCQFVLKSKNISQSNKTRNYKKENNPNYNNHKLKGENNPKSKKVAQYDFDGNLIKVWDYAKQVTEELNINYSTLKTILQGKRKTSKYKGFIWKYYIEGDNNE